MNLIANRLNEARGQFCFSGYQLFFQKHGTAARSLYGGETSYWPPANPVTPRTLFDIGSVTKAVVTTSLMALAVDAGTFRLEHTVGQLVPQWAKTPLAKISLEQLLSHSAGLRWWYPVAEETSRAGFLEWFAKKANILCEAPPGRRAVYSDLGFMVLGVILETHIGELVTEYQQKIASPLKMSSVVFGPTDPSHCVATEYHLKEKRLIHGEVFDDNARGWDGKAPHAGLFASAQGLAPWAEEWLKAYHGESQWLSQKTARRFTHRANHIANSSWALGWDTKSELGSSAGSLFSLESFGHLGFTGSSVWIDPIKRGFAIFLTNRVHPSRLDERIRQIRPWVHDEVAKTW